MTSITLTLQLHQPYRIRSDYHFFNIGSNHLYEDTPFNQMVIKDNVKYCYLPVCKMLHQQIINHNGKFRVSLLISGTTLEQFEQHSPDMILIISELVQTGCVELITSTHHHSFAGLFSPAEFINQTSLHHTKIHELFGYHASTFCNTALIYNNKIAEMVQKAGYKTLIADEQNASLEWRSPNYVYMPCNCYKTTLLLRNSAFSEDLSQYFSTINREGEQLSIDRYRFWLQELRHHDIINILLNFDSFNKGAEFLNKQCKFMDEFINSILTDDNFQFLTPNQIAGKHEPVGKLCHDQPALSKWLGNPLQDSANEQAYNMSPDVLLTKDTAIINDWRRLLSSDHFNDMSYGDRDMSHPPNIYTSCPTPQEAYISFINALNDIQFRIENI